MRLVLSLLLMSVGAAMWFSAASPATALGLNVATAGLILMVAGILELAAGAVLWAPPTNAVSKQERPGVASSAQRTHPAR